MAGKASRLLLMRSFQVPLLDQTAVSPATSATGVFGHLATPRFWPSVRTLSRLYGTAFDRFNFISSPALRFGVSFPQTIPAPSTFKPHSPQLYLAI
jgi:hypothetical protein